MNVTIEQPCVGCLLQAHAYVPALVQVAQGPVCIGHMVQYDERRDHLDLESSHRQEKIAAATITKLDKIGQALASQASSETSSDRRLRIQQLADLVGAASTREQKALELLRADTRKSSRATASAT